jgi:hypothetical protein
MLELLRLFGDAAFTLVLVGGLWRVIDTPRRLAVHWYGEERGHGTVLLAMGMTLALTLGIVAASRALAGSPRWLGWFGL